MNGGVFCWHADDMMAIFMVFQVPEIEVIGLTSIYGNVHTPLATKNCLHLVGFCSFWMLNSASKKTMLNCIGNAVNLNFMDFTQYGQASWLTRQLITSMIRVMMKLCFISCLNRLIKALCVRSVLTWDLLGVCCIDRSVCMWQLDVAGFPEVPVAEGSMEPLKVTIVIRLTCFCDSSSH